MTMFDVPRPTVSVQGGGADFPVRRIYCIGRNYGAHAREMGGDPAREPPFFFMKPADSVLASGSALDYPSRTNDLQHEIELVVALGKGGRDVPATDALACVFGYAAGIDFTRRDLQRSAKEKGRPWEPGKSFDGAAAISPISSVAEVGHPATGRIWLTVNDETRQDADLGDMIWSVPEAIAELSTLFALAPGDLLYTGTPAGVSQVQRGDRIHGGIEGVGGIAIDVR